MPSVDEILDYYDKRSEDIPFEIFEIADQLFDITDDDDIPQDYYLWIGRQMMRLDRGSQL